MNNRDVFEGVVVWFNIKSGYGFISIKDKEDIFVHFSDIKSDGFKMLRKDDCVKFNIGKNSNGKPKAINVELL